MEQLNTSGEQMQDASFDATSYDKVNERSTIDQGMSEIDWRKVGKIHSPDTAVEEVIGKEMERLHKVLDIKMESQIEEFNRREMLATANKKK
jgi:hypothetical protein